MSEEEKSFWTKLWEGIKNFFKKFWYVILVPVGLFLIHLIFKDPDKELKKEIKEEEKEIKKEEKEIKKQEEVVEKKETNLKQETQKTEDLVKEQKESQEQKKANLSDILPGLKK